jgi:hypothetical protein
MHKLKYVKDNTRTCCHNCRRYEWPDVTLHRYNKKNNLPGQTDNTAQIRIEYLPYRHIFYKTEETSQELGGGGGKYVPRIAGQPEGGKLKGNGDYPCQLVEGWQCLPRY